MDFTASYGRPIQGVSQQPPQVRQEGQCTAQVNCIPSPVDGLKTRVGSTLVSVLMDKITTGSKVYFYRRDEQESYVMIFGDDPLPHIYDLQGNEAVVTGNSTYIQSGVKDPRDRLTMVTVGDYTFVVNNEVDVLPRPDVYSSPINRAVVTVSYATYGRTYKIIIDDTDVFSYKAPTGKTDTDIDKVDTSYVATELKKEIDKNAAYVAEQNGPYLFIRRADHHDFNIKSEDGAGGKDLIVTKGTVDKLANIPAHAPDHTYVAVRQSGATDIAEYYLKVDGTRSDGRANWVETAKAGIKAGINKDTMPHVIVRDSIDNNGIAHFSISTGDWADRTVGNNKSNPFPSFCDEDNPKPISSIGVFQNRLYVTSGENLITSRTDDYFDFFRFTAQKELDTDPIDILSDTKQINLIKSSAIIGGDLILFANHAQFLLRGDVPQTKKTATLTVINEYDCVASVQPVSSGDNLYFPFTYGRYGGVREMFIDNNSGTKRARPITDHVNKYIDGHIHHMAGTTNINTLFVSTDTDRHKMYVYDWVWVGSEKKQSAWHEWWLPEGSEIIGFEYINNRLYIISNQNDKCILEYFDMSDAPTYGLDFRVRMDRRYTMKFYYDANSNEWKSRAALEHKPKDISTVEFVTIDSDNPIDNGNTIPVTVDPKTFIVSTPYPLSSNTIREVTLSVGELYDVEYEPTPPQLKDYKGQVSTITKTILGALYFNFDHVGHFAVEVEDKYGYKWSGDFNNRRMGAPNNIVGFAPLANLVEEVPVRMLAKDIKFRIKTRTHISMQLRDIEWTGTSNPSKRRR